MAKLGNFATETLLRTQMFASLTALEKFVADANLASRTQGNIIESSQIHSCFQCTNFASETNVSHFSHIGRNSVF